MYGRSHTSISFRSRQTPEYVADQLDIGLDEVHEALAYYYRYPDEMREIREKNRELEQELKEKSMV
ncbi:MAG: hypothetical protein SXQ77_00750 [Halobacteria archaeon]|nr:hypothetical protein [Halobacteria archaeon]